MTAACLLALTGAAVGAYWIVSLSLLDRRRGREAATTAAHLDHLSRLRAVPYESLAMARRAPVVGGCGW